VIAKLPEITMEATGQFVTNRFETNADFASLNCGERHSTEITESDQEGHTAMRLRPKWSRRPCGNRQDRAE
jgi:hypothetical protein